MPKKDASNEFLCINLKIKKIVEGFGEQSHSGRELSEEVMLKT